MQATPNVGDWNCHRNQFRSRISKFHPLPNRESLLIPDHDQHLTTQTDALSTHAATHLFTQLFESAAEDVEFGERGHRRFHPGQVEQHRLAVMGSGQSGEM